MPIIEPVSSLSIRRAVNLYTIILLMSFGALLYWLGTDRYQVFIHLHENTARNTTKIVSYEIHKALKEKQRVVDMFVEVSKNLITTLSNNPKNEIAHQTISSRLKKYQPDYFTFNIFTASGIPTITNFNTDISKRCLKDIKHYIDSGEQRIRLHHSNNVSHYDIISKYSHNNSEHLFFVSFNANEISDLLNSAEAEEHNLMLVNKGANNQIEITSQGDRQTTSSKPNIKLRGDESLNVLSSIEVKGTSWHIVDTSDKDLFNNHRYKIIKEFLIAYYIFAMIVLFMRYILLKQDAKRSVAEEQLQKNHDQIKVLNNRLEQLSKTDSLTGLYNRRYLDETATHEWNRGLRSKSYLSCILLDIDHFKHYNDYYGHQAGDKCIKAISALLKKTFRRAGDTVARYGGEEFIIIMSDSSEEEAKTAIINFQKALEKLRIPHEASETSDIVTASAGLIVQVPSKDNSIEAFIRNADKALYSAKEAGRNQWVLHKEKAKKSHWASKM